MRKFLLYSSALVVFGLSGGTVEAACIKTPTCSSLGYESTTSCSGGLKCPFGNAWNCTLANEIAQLKITIEKLEQTAQQEALAKCKVGDILYHDMTCNANIVASKTPIGVIFDVTNGLAIAKDEFNALSLSTVSEDLPGITNYTASNAKTDWQGFNNTKAMYEADPTGAQYPAAKKVLTYTTVGTTQGQWYIPAMGELNAIIENRDTLNATLTKLAGTEISGQKYWSSTEGSDSGGYCYDGSDLSLSGKYSSQYVRPVINFVSKNKINVAYTNGGSETTCKIGSILYSDKKCYSGELQSNKTPIGIVFDPEKRLAAALDYGADSWGYPRDIPNLPNYSNKDDAKQDFNGKSNTAAIIAYAKSSGKSYPAAEYAYNYTTEGTKAGDWYLPAYGEISQVYSYRGVLGYAKSIALSNPYGTENIMGYSGYAWSSTEVSADNAWANNSNGGTASSRGKNNSHSVLPVLAY